MRLDTAQSYTSDGDLYDLARLDALGHLLGHSVLDRADGAFTLKACFHIYMGELCVPSPRRTKIKWLSSRERCRGKH